MFRYIFANKRDLSLSKSNKKLFVYILKLRERNYTRSLWEIREETKYKWMNSRAEWSQLH